MILFACTSIIRRILYFNLFSMHSNLLTTILCSTLAETSVATFPTTSSACPQQSQGFSIGFEPI